jgi:hypothetical protein
MDEKRKIIDMVVEGKISPQEAEKLLSALNTSAQIYTQKGKKIVFSIIKEGSKKPKIKFSIPIKLAKIGMKFIPKDAKINTDLGNTNFDMSSIDWNEIISMASSGEVGDLFFMEVDEDDGIPMTIRIYVE